MRNKWFGIALGTFAANILLAASLTGCTSTSDTTAKATDETSSDATTVAGTTASEAQAALDASGLLSGGMFGGGMGGGRGHFGPMGGDGGAVANLTDEQKAQLEAIWQQVQNGEMTREQAHEQIQTLLGDILPDGGPHQRIADALALTEEQKAAAEDIHTAARTDIEALVESGRAQFRALLTEEQIATLDSLEAEREASADFYGPHSDGMGPHGFGGVGRVVLNHGHGGGEAADGHAFRLAEALSLTDEQKSAWESIREETRTAIEARHEAARDAIRALLTEEQLATLDELEAQHGRP